MGGFQASQRAELKALKTDAAAEARRFSQVPNLDGAARYSRQASFFFDRYIIFFGHWCPAQVGFSDCTSVLAGWASGSCQCKMKG
jgi:hypothetical protein